MVSAHRAQHLMGNVDSSGCLLPRVERLVLWKEVSDSCSDMRPCPYRGLTSRSQVTRTGKENVAWDVGVHSGCLLRFFL